MAPDDLLCSHNAQAGFSGLFDSFRFSGSRYQTNEIDQESQTNQIDQMNQPPLDRRLRELVEIAILLYRICEVSTCQ